MSIDTTNVTEITLEDMFKDWEEDDMLKIIFRGLNYKATHMIELECVVMDSSMYGRLWKMFIGPNNTYKTVDDAIKACENGGLYVTGLPSSASFVKRWCVFNPKVTQQEVTNG